MTTHEPALDPRAASRLLEDTTSSTHRAIDVPTGPLLLIWGAAYAIGYLAIWIDVRDQSPYTGPNVWSMVVLSVALGAAMVATMLVIYRATRGIVGATSRHGTFYGLAWWVGFGLWAVMMGAVRGAGANDEVLGLLAGALPTLIVAVIYCVSAALWDSPAMVVTGVWLGIATGIAVVTGPVTMCLVLGTLGALGFAAGALADRRAA